MVQTLCSCSRRVLVFRGRIVPSIVYLYVPPKLSLHPCMEAPPFTIFQISWPLPHLYLSEHCMPRLITATRPRKIMTTARSERNNGSNAWRLVHLRLSCLAAEVLVMSIIRMFITSRTQESLSTSMNPRELKAPTNRLQCMWFRDQESANQGLESSPGPSIRRSQLSLSI